MTARECQVFRYPGSKAKLAADPVFQNLFVKNFPTSTFYEAFAGSAAVSIALAVAYDSIEFWMCEKDPEIFSFWSLMANGSDAEFNTLHDYLSIPPTVEMFYQYRSSVPKCRVEKAYRAVFFNRTTFSGIAIAAPIGGRAQSSRWGIACRYNSEKMIRQTGALRRLFAGRLKVAQGSAVDWVSTLPRDAPVYLDPPYYEMGPRLYRHSMTPDEHKKLADVLRDRKNWVLSYDACDQVRDLYREFANCLPLQMDYSIRAARKENTHYGKEELLILPRTV